MLVIFIVCGLFVLILFLFVTVSHDDYTDPLKGPNDCQLIWEEHLAKRAIAGDKLHYLGKKQRQQIRGVDLYRCQKCGQVGAPWEINHWKFDLDTVEEDRLPDACRCGGTVILIDD